MPDTIATVVELPDDMRDPMRREINRGLMRDWINNQLEARANHDIRTSLAFYDEDGLFDLALPASIAELSNFDEILRKLYAQTNLRYYSKGI